MQLGFVFASLRSLTAFRKNMKHAKSLTVYFFDKIVFFSLITDHFRFRLKRYLVRIAAKLAFFSKKNSK